MDKGGLKHLGVDFDNVPEILVERPPAEKVLGNNKLPIAAVRDEIVDSIDKNSVTIITAKTGTGKSTQVIQYLLEETDEYGRPLYSVMQTSPRIVAAREVHSRVVQEIKQAVPEEGYSTGYYTSIEGSSEPQHAVRGAFLTDGKAVMQLLHNRKPKRHYKGQKWALIIDEVHELNTNIEMLLALAAKMTNPKSEYYDPDVRIVLMSATMDSARLKKFYAHTSTKQIDVEAPTFPVVKKRSKRKASEIALEHAEGLDTVLAFYPGRREIKTSQRLIAGLQRTKTSDKRVKRHGIPVLPLHAQQFRHEQQEAFRSYPNGVVIATTNVAETSLTVPDAKVVVDTGHVRVDRVRYDLIPVGSDGLYHEHAPQSSLDQRAGRVGRTSKGTYVLAHSDNGEPPAPFRSREKYQTPAIQRNLLDGLLLTLKGGGKDFKDFGFFHEPSKEATEAARTKLYNLGAINERGHITARGIFMNQLPLEPEYACMIAVAYEREYPIPVKRAMIDIAAIMQSGGILKRAPKEDRWRSLLKSDDATAAESYSDLFAQLKIYEKLTDGTIPQKEWNEYDILEFAASNVEERRRALLERLGLEHKPAVMLSRNEFRRAMTCIVAGHINQLWRGVDGGWMHISQEKGKGMSFDLSVSSSVPPIGNFIVGKLFTLGFLDGDELHQVQDATQAEPAIIESAVPHLVTESIVRGSERFDPIMRIIMADVVVHFNGSTLRTVNKKIDHESSLRARDLQRQGELAEEYKKFLKDHPRVRPLGLSELELRKVEPEFRQLTVDENGKPIYLFRMGNGKWTTSEEVARRSLEIRHSNLLRRIDRLSRRHPVDNSDQPSHDLAGKLAPRRGSVLWRKHRAGLYRRRR